jgi:hypothetical protein
MKDKKFNDGSKMQVLQVYKSNEQPMTQTEVKDIVKDIMAGFKDNNKYQFNIRGHAGKINKNNISVRGLAPDMWHTLKNKNDDVVNYKNEDEYLQDRVVDKNKFKQYYQLQITLYKNK